MENKHWWDTEEGQEFLSSHPYVEDQYNVWMEENTTYGVGDIFEVFLGGVKGADGVLCQVDAGVVELINMKSWNRHADGVKVSNIHSITRGEMNQIFGASSGEWTFKRKNK